MSKAIRIIAVLLMIKLLAACAPGSPPHEVVITTRQAIGPAGGTVQDASGASVAIPEGALNQETLIEIGIYTRLPTARLPERVTLAGTVHFFGPDGIQFNKPVTVTLPYDPDMVPPGQERTRLRLLVYQRGPWRVIENITVDTEAKTISGQTPTFSGFAPARHTPIIR